MRLYRDRERRANCRQRFSFPFSLFFSISFGGRAGGFRLEPMGFCWWRVGRSASGHLLCDREGGGVRAIGM